MLHVSKAIQIAQDGKPHDFEFMAKGSSEKNIRGGYVVNMPQSVVLSSNHKRRKMNLKSLASGQIRWCYYVLLTKFDNHEVVL